MRNVQLVGLSSNSSSAHTEFFQTHTGNWCNWRLIAVQILPFCRFVGSAESDLPHAETLNSSTVKRCFLLQHQRFAKIAVWPLDYQLEFHVSRLEPKKCSKLRRWDGMFHGWEISTEISALEKTISTRLKSELFNYFLLVLSYIRSELRTCSRCQLCHMTFLQILNLLKRQKNSTKRQESTRV